jgi:hypothetical protein
VINKDVFHEEIILEKSSGRLFRFIKSNWPNCNTYNVEHFIAYLKKNGWKENSFKNSEPFSNLAIFRGDIRLTKNEINLDINDSTTVHYRCFTSDNRDKIQFRPCFSGYFADVLPFNELGFKNYEFSLNEKIRKFSTNRAKSDSNGVWMYESDIKSECLNQIKYLQDILDTL